MQSRLLQDPTFSDVTVLVGVEETPHKLHKAIICHYSDFFRTTCASKFIEAETGVIRLPEANDRLFRYVIEYLYSADGTIESLDDDDNSTFDVSEIFALADMLGIYCLKRWILFYLVDTNLQRAYKKSGHKRKSDDVVNEIEALNNLYLHADGEMEKKLSKLLNFWVGLVKRDDPNLLSGIVSFVREDLALENGFMVDVLLAVGGRLIYDK